MHADITYWYTKVIIDRNFVFKVAIENTTVCNNLTARILYVQNERICLGKQHSVSLSTLTVLC